MTHDEKLCKEMADLVIGSTLLEASLMARFKKAIDDDRFYYEWNDLNINKYPSKTVNRLDAYIKCYRKLTGK